MKKIEIGKKYRTRNGRDVRILCVDAERISPVVGLVTNTKNGGDWIGEWIGEWCSYGRYLGECRGQHEYDLVEVSPYADIPIDTPGWARNYGGRWFARYFAGVTDEGRPTAWLSGATSFSSGGERLDWQEFTTTKPEGV